ncbi:hypothetical protein NDU88_005663 [Pleurodeles waltl]|uniref:Uncharacterized protein n=1 Tax=Pleurodeles waltl TaxID=8319 RepID=A0AAV7N173_PLEWA|nr:hypothetical protein NDU88_005663 [Pleurodeles waltl]
MAQLSKLSTSYAVQAPGAWLGAKHGSRNLSELLWSTRGVHLHPAGKILGCTECCRGKDVGTYLGSSNSPKDSRGVLQDARRKKLRGCRVPSMQRRAMERISGVAFRSPSYESWERSINVAQGLSLAAPLN